MNEFDATRTPEEEDPLVHEWLSSLPAFTPRAGFEDAVLAQVWTPPPRWIRSLRATASMLLAGRRKWVWAGGAAAASFVATLGVAMWAITHWMQVETAWSVVVNGLALETWRALVTTVGTAAASVLYVTQSVGVTLQAVFVATLVGAALSAACAWGLFHLVRDYSVRMELHASS